MRASRVLFCNSELRRSLSSFSSFCNSLARNLVSIIVRSGLPTSFESASSVSSNLIRSSESIASDNLSNATRARAERRRAFSVV